MIRSEESSNRRIGNLWVSTSAGEISKVDAQNYTTIIQTNTLPGDAISTQSASYASTPCITAQGDTLWPGGTAQVPKSIVTFLVKPDGSDGRCGKHRDNN